MDDGGIIGWSGIGRTSLLSGGVFAWLIPQSKAKPVLLLLLSAAELSAAIGRTIGARVIGNAATGNMPFGCGRAGSDGVVSALTATSSSIDDEFANYTARKIRVK